MEKRGGMERQAGGRTGGVEFEVNTCGGDWRQ